MGKSQRLTVGHVREVFRLLGEIRELGASPLVWRRHMLQGIRGLVGADMAHAAELILPGNPVAPRYAGVVIDGLADAARLDGYLCLVRDNNYSEDPTHPAVMQMMSQSFTQYRQQLAEDRVWYRRADLDAWRTVSIDQIMYSHQYLWDGSKPLCIHVAGFTRDWGRPAFTERERQIIELVHDELGRLWGDRRADLADRLPRRLRQVLDCLLEGACEKEIAEVIGISRHTVHDYVKAIYQRFEVGSHARLLAKVARSRVTQTPRLAGDRLARAQPPASPTR